MISVNIYTVQTAWIKIETAVRTGAYYCCQLSPFNSYWYI